MSDNGQPAVAAVHQIAANAMFWASIRGSATLCFSRWTQRRGRQLHRFQNRCTHRAWLLTEKALRSRCSVRPREEKVVNSGAALPLAGQVKSSKWMAAQRPIAVSPLYIGTRALEHTGEPLGFVMELGLSLGAQRAQDAAGFKQRGAKPLGELAKRFAITDGARLGHAIEIVRGKELGVHGERYRKIKGIGKSKGLFHRRRVLPCRPPCATGSHSSASRPAAAGPPRVPEGCSSLIAGLLLAARSSETVSRAQHGQSVSERQAAVCGLPGALAVRQPACCRQGARPRPAGVGRRPVARGQPGAGRRWRGCHGKSGFIFPIRSPWLHYRRK